MVGLLSYAQRSYCTISVVAVNALRPCVIFPTVAFFFLAPHVSLVLPSSLLLWVSLVGITFISFVGVYGKGSPLDTSLYIYLISFHAWVSYSGLVFFFDVAGVRLVSDLRDMGWCLFP